MLISKSTKGSLLNTPVLCQDPIGRVWFVAHEVLVQPDGGVLLLELIELLLVDPKDATVVPVSGADFQMLLRCCFMSQWHLL